MVELAILLFKIVSLNKIYFLWLAMVITYSSDMVPYKRRYVYPFSNVRGLLGSNLGLLVHSQEYRIIYLIDVDDGRR